VQPNEGSWPDATSEERDILASVPDSIIVSPPVAEGQKWRIFAWHGSTRVSESDEDRTTALRRVVKKAAR
jgi:hypothetical protein